VQLDRLDQHPLQRSVAFDLVARHDRLRNGFDRNLVETGQDAIDSIKLVIARNAPRQWGSHHSAQELRDMRPVTRSTEGHHHFSARAVPAGADRILGNQDANFVTFLHPFWL
jgi:hypothetical protein